MKSNEYKKLLAITCAAAMTISGLSVAYAEEGPGMASWDDAGAPDIPSEGGDDTSNEASDTSNSSADNNVSDGGGQSADASASQEATYVEQPGESYDAGYTYDVGDSYDEGSQDGENEWRPGMDEYTADTEKTSDDVEGTIHKTTTEKASVETATILTLEDAKKDFYLLSYSEIPSYMSLSVPEILQKPELPTGCESVALTMALRYEGFDVGKTTVADEYLIYNYESDNMALGYVGDPFSEEGAGCFPPVLAATADYFFTDQDADYSVYNITGTSMNDLLSYVAGGTPVIVWNTMYMLEPEFTRQDCEFNGEVYQWYAQEHCVVLTGYDLSAGTLQINDPLEGIVDRDMEEFTRLYNKTGQMAIVLKENTNKASDSTGSDASSTNTEVGLE